MGLLAAQRPSACAGAAEALWLSAEIWKRVDWRARGQQVMKSQCWHEVVVGTQQQGQEHPSYCRRQEEAGAEGGGSTRLSEGRKLKEQKRQMKRIRRVHGKERNQGKAERRKRNRKVNTNRNSNKAKRRWCRHRLGGFQDPGGMGRAGRSSASEDPPSRVNLSQDHKNHPCTRGSCKGRAEHSGGHFIARKGTARSPREPRPTPCRCRGRILAMFPMQNSTQ